MPTEISVAQTSDSTNLTSTINKPLKENVSESKEEEKSVIVENGQKNETEKESEFKMSGAEIHKMMNSKGSIVKSLVLLKNGEIKEIDYDTTPKLNMVQSILNCRPTIIGEWDELQVILVKGRIEDMNENDKEESNQNTHKLRFPFTRETIYGDILLYRVDSEGVPQDFSLEEYETFQSDSHLDKNKSYEEFDKMYEEMEEEEAQETEEMDMTHIRLTIRENVRKQWIEKNGCEPSEEELEKYSQTVESMFTGQGLVDICEETEESDPEYNPQDEIEEEEEDEETSPESKEQGEENEELPEDWREMFENVLQTNVKNAGSQGRAELLKRVQQMYEEETGEKADSQEINNAFENLKNKVMGNEEENEIENENDESVADEPNLEEKCEDPESEDEVSPISEEEMRKEIREAFEHIRGLGQLHGKQMAVRFRDTFYEVNGREPEEEELVGIFDRLKQQFADEAADEIFDEEENEEFENDSLAEKSIEKNINFDKELISFARSTLSEQMIENAKTQFSELTQRDATDAELNHILVKLCTTPFVDAQFSEEPETEESEYKPSEAEIAQVEKADELEDSQTELPTREQVSLEIKDLMKSDENKNESEIIIDEEENEEELENDSEYVPEKDIENQEYESECENESTESEEDFSINDIKDVKDTVHPLPAQQTSD